MFKDLGKYWYFAPILLLIAGLPVGFGYATTQTPVGLHFTAMAKPAPVLAAANNPPTAAPTRRPTFTPTPLPPTATNTPVPTWTPSPTPPPTATLTPALLPTPLAIAPRGFGVTVPILMYHYLSEPPAGADAVRRDLSVSPAQFEAQLIFLHEQGYHTITMKQLSYALSRNEALPPKPIIITFDDGYRDQYTNAFPLLKKYGDVATFFVFTQVIDEYNVDFLTWEMVTEMHQAGMEFGSHSYRHPDLTNRSVDFLVYEILGSKEAIEARIGEPVRFFCYPSGRYDDLAERVVASANFWGAVTTEWGAQHSYANRFEIHRLRMRGNDTVDKFAAKLAIVTE